MVTPKFFYSRKPLTLSALYTIFIATFPILLLIEIVSLVHQLCRYFYRVNCYHIKPLIVCVGGLVCGGSGKTPTCIMMAKMVSEFIFFDGSKNCYQRKDVAKDADNNFLNVILCKLNDKMGERRGNLSEQVRVAFLSKGYGYSKKNSQPYAVVTKHNYDFVNYGDEIGELTNYGDVLFVKNRYDIKKIDCEKYDIVIMDDGLFDMSLGHDLDIVVADSFYLFGNCLPLPLGPMRNMRIMLKLILFSFFRRNLFDVLFYIKSSQRTVSNPPLFANECYEVAVDYCLPHKKTSYIAFSGIGINDKFFSALDRYGFNIIERISFPDHYNYSEGDIAKLIAKKCNKNCSLITTRKDFNRISNYDCSAEIDVVDISFQITCKLI